MKPDDRQPTTGETPCGKPAVDDDVDASEDLGKDRASAKKTESFAVVTTRAREFLEALRDGAIERLKQGELYRHMAEVVFSYWAARLHHSRTWLDPKRERRIVARLRETKGEWGMMLYAVDGALRDSHLMGERMDSERRYDGISTIFRDLEQVERLAEMVPAYRAGQEHPLVVKYQNGNGHA